MTLAFMNNNSNNSAKSTSSHYYDRKRKHSDHDSPIMNDSLILKASKLEIGPKDLYLDEQRHDHRESFGRKRKPDHEPLNDAEMNVELGPSDEPKRIRQDNDAELIQEPMEQEMVLPCRALIPYTGPPTLEPSIPLLFLHLDSTLFPRTLPSHDTPMPPSQTKTTESTAHEYDSEQQNMNKQIVLYRPFHYE